MITRRESALVTSEWLEAHLDAPDVRIIDATWFLPTIERNARAEFEKCHIPKAVFVDIDLLSDPDHPAPHMLPDAVMVSSRLRKLGIGDGHRIVVYDNNMSMASTRIWWMLRHFGHEDVFVLDGGLKCWINEDRPVTDETRPLQERHFTPRAQQIMVRSLRQIRSNLLSSKEQLLDARSAERFSGQAPEPRAGLKSGHIPGSLNLPFDQLLDPVTGRFLGRGALKALFEGARIDLRRPVITTCGSGVSAATLALALYEIGKQDVALYDGSWSEWGALPDTPVER